MGDLEDFLAEADRNSPFIKFEDGVAVIGVYKKTERVPDPFDKTKKEYIMQYTLEVDGVNKTFKSKSVKLARLFSQFKVGDEVQVVKTGEGFQTLWYVTEPK